MHALDSSASESKAIFCTSVQCKRTREQIQNNSICSRKIVNEKNNTEYSKAQILRDSFAVVQVTHTRSTRIMDHETVIQAS